MNTGEQQNRTSNPWPVNKSNIIKIVRVLLNAVWDKENGEAGVQGCQHQVVGLSFRG